MKEFLDSISNNCETFIGQKYKNDQPYKFGPHFEYFLENKTRWNNTNDILNRVTTETDSSNDRYWENWRKFRSAQAEITSIFLLEKLLGIRIKNIEQPRNNNPKTCDLLVKYQNEEYFFEIKAQSGQQHGDKIPSQENKHVYFNPKFEEDLSSWLFEKKVSSRDGKEMNPDIYQVEEKKRMY